MGSWLGSLRQALGRTRPEHDRTGVDRPDSRRTVGPGSAGGAQRRNFLRSDQTALRIIGERKLPQLVLRRRARWKSRGAASAAADLRRVLTIAGATVVETGLALPRAFAQFTSDGQLADARIEHQLHAVLSELMQAPTLRRLAA